MNCDPLISQFQQFQDFDQNLMEIVLSVSKFTANLYCICLSINLWYTYADADLREILGHAVLVLDPNPHTINADQC